MPHTYDQLGVKFLYPENWTITDEQAVDWPKSVTVQSPNSAFWTLYIYEGDVNLRSLAREVVDALKDEYPQLEEEELLDCDDGADYGFDLFFYYLDLLISAEVRAVLVKGGAYVWLIQGENRDLTEHLPVFHAMVLSLLNKIPAPE